MATRPTKDWQDAPSTATPLTAAALEDLEDREFDYTEAVGAETLASANAAVSGLTATVTALTNTVAALSTSIGELVTGAEREGAVPGGGSGAANTTAINTALVNNDRLVIEAGKSYDITGPIIIPKDNTTLEIQGELRCASGWSGTAAIKMGDGTAQRYGGGVTGTGNIYCARRPTNFMELNAWRKATIQDLNFFDPLTNGIVVKNTHSGVAPIADCDSHLFLNLFMRSDGAVYTDLEKPARMFVFDGSGARITSDCTVSNCTAIGGLLPSTIAANNTDNLSGGYGAELISAGRINFENCRWYNHGERAQPDPMPGGADKQVGSSGGYFIRTLNNNDCNAWTIRNPYCEATVTTGQAHSAWVWRHIRVVNAAGTGNIEWGSIEGLLQSVNTLSTNDAKRLHLFNSATPSGALGNVRYNRYLRPRNLLGPTATGQIIIGANCNENYIETMTNTEAQGTEVTLTGTGNAVHALAPRGERP